MNIAIVCAGMPVIPLVVYFIMSMAGVSSLFKVIVPEVFVILYVVFIAIIIVKKAENEEKIKQKQS
ncbi:hypothetical protein NEMIN01_1492 [Nematocida minor]|uniref:uncharacterized protein n=1 Tax=Nematocida minor TaxID=1912983 RepID=UPI0022203CF6|nr:uncharacterized protein NEMIN01_1492 [Nematocida minor]KAI5191416.1 hypothetical protein NEMIN01_1492 [Nematocida minor]